MNDRTGRLVHYVLAEGPCKGEHRPALVVKDWSAGFPPGVVNLQVFTDDANDGQPGRMWVASCPYDEGGTVPYSWHFPEE